MIEPQILVHALGHGQVLFPRPASPDQVADGFPFPIYYRKINWKIAAQSPRLVSIYSDEEEFAGGAHPNQSFKALLWDKSKSQLIPTGKLFAPTPT